MHEFTGSPNSSRIVHDCLLAIDAMYNVYEAKGKIVTGLCGRNDIRAVKETLGNGLDFVKNHTKLAQIRG